MGSPLGPPKLVEYPPENSNWGLQSLWVVTYCLRNFTLLSSSLKFPCAPHLTYHTTSLRSTLCTLCPSIHSCRILKTILAIPKTLICCSWASITQLTAITAKPKSSSHFFLDYQFPTPPYNPSFKDKSLLGNNDNNHLTPYPTSPQDKTKTPVNSGSLFFSQLINCSGYR